MIVVQPFYNNFWKTFFHIHIILLSSLFIFPSPFFLFNKKEEKELSQKLSSK